MSSWLPENREFRRQFVVFLATVLIVSIIMQVLFGFSGALIVFVLAVTGGYWISRNFGRRY